MSDPVAIALISSCTTLASTVIIILTGRKATDKLERKSDVVHSLVNSNLTEAKQSVLDSTDIAITALRELADTAGEPKPSTTEAIKSAVKRRDVLAQAIEDRSKE